MNEPLRWLEDPTASTTLLEVLAAAPEAPAMTGEHHARLGAYATGLLCTGVAAKSTAAGLAAKSLAALVASSTGTKVALCLALMGASGAVGYSIVGSRIDGATTSVRSREPERVSLAMSVGVARSTSTAPTAEQVRTAVVTVTTSDGRPEPPRIGVQPTLQPAKATPSAVSALEEPSIADEAKLLEMARSALGSDPALALEYVARHARRHPDGQLSAERELIAVDALLRLGRRSEAEQRAAPRLQQAPGSLYSRRLRQLLAK
jgi:hypothetical protein